MIALAFAILAAAFPPQQGLLELHAMCAADGGRMWGVSLCGPTMIVDQHTRAVVADREAPAVLPKEIGLANTAVDWNGKRWTMVMGPLPDDAFARKMLLAHESFHRIQDSIGFPVAGPANAHLDAVEGRYWLRLEWRALQAALQGDRAAIRDALLFRAMRRSLFPTAAKEEHDLEMHEGLAEYTGAAMAEPDASARASHLVTKLHEAEATPTFVRSFAYASGPAWGTLLDRKRRRWTRALRRTDDLGELVATAWHVMLPADVAALANERAQPYDGVSLLAEEGERDAKKQEMLRAFRIRFIDGPVLVLPLRHMSFQFDPNASQPFGSYGTVYPTLTLRDDWGSIEVKHGGALINSNFTQLTVPAAAGDDYVLTLTSGWSIEGGKVVDKR
jgi:hypothetical protein